MLRVGLSGGIGSGKSTVARRLTERGAVVVDADVVAREVVEPGSEGLRELVSRFGSEILDAEGALDRPAMARRVFGDDAARAELNSVVHPRIGERTAELMGRAPSDAVLVHDIPLLVEAGYQPEIAYFEVLHELKLIVDLMWEGGIAGQRYSCSDTATYGDLTRGPRVIDSRVKESMRQVLAEIQDGSFAKEWVAEDEAGRPKFNQLQEEGNAHQIEEVGSRLRSLMSWTNK